MPAIKLSINAAVDGFKGDFSLFVNHSTIFDLSTIRLPIQSNLLGLTCILFTTE